MRGLERRLRRLEALVGRWAAERSREADTLGARQIVAKIIRAGLKQAGLDPNEAVALRRFEQPEPEPEPTPRSGAAGQPGGAGPLDILYERLLALVPRRPEDMPDLATASPAKLFAAYCFAGDPAEGG